MDAAAAACQKNGSSSNRGRGKGEQERGGRGEDAAAWGLLRWGRRTNPTVETKSTQSCQGAAGGVCKAAWLPQEGARNGEGGRRRKKRGERLSREGSKLVGRGCGLDRVQIESRALVAIGWRGAAEAGRDSEEKRREGGGGAESWAAFGGRRRCAKMLNWGYVYKTETEMCRALCTKCLWQARRVGHTHTLTDTHTRTWCRQMAASC